MRYLKFLIITLIMTVCSNSCNSDYIFEKELYKQVISLICSDTYNVLSDTQELTGEEVESYIAVSVGGTGTTSTDIRLAIVEDETKLVDYNFNNYDADVSRYAQRLPVWRYTIDDAHIIVPKGERTGKMKIKFNPNGLSPDTAYFLPLAIASTSAYEINQKKNYLMYRVLIKNFYAQQQSAATSYTLYSDNGMKGSVSFSLNKQVQPLTKNSVRMMAGDLEFKSTVASYEAGAIVVTVGDDNKLTIKPYKEDGTLQVTQVDGDANYPNTFTLENDWGTKWKKFLLHYKYKAGTAAEVDMREELKLEYTDED